MTTKPVHVAVVNQKGGVGKTTTTLNLGVGLARSGFRVLAIDLDPQAHLTLGLGIDSDQVAAEKTVAVLFREPQRLPGLVADTAEPNLKLVPASIRLAREVESLYGVIFREVKLREALQAAPATFDYVLMDCGPSLGVLSVNALVAADRILIPAQPSMYSLDGLSDLLDTLHTVKNGSSGHDWRILLTMVSGQAEERNEAAAKMLRPISDRMLATRIRRTEAIERSQMRDGAQPGAVILERQSWNRGARDYRKLVKEILEVWPAR